MSFHSLIEQALENAPLVDVHDPTPNDYSQYKDAPDDYKLCLNPEDNTALDTVYTDAEEDNLGDIFKALGEVTGELVDEQYITHSVYHERQHWRAAQMLGAISGRFGVTFRRLRQANDKDPVLSYQPLLAVRNMTTTKLGAALLAGYPIHPSQGDILDVESYGYAGLHELAEKAALLNSGRRGSADTFYPVPMSVSSFGMGLNCGGISAATQLSARQATPIR